jgi:hypothetical protein
MSFRSVLCVLIISHKEEEKVFSHRKRCASRRVERERERDVTLERSSAFAFRTTPSKSSPRGNNNRKRIEIFHSLSLSLLEEEDQKRKKREKTRECVSVVVSLLRARVTFRALISSGGGKDGGRFVSDCLSEFSVFLYSFLGFTTLISCAPFLFFPLLQKKAALEMTTNEEDDDDDIDCEEEEELLRRDVDRLLEEIAFLEETSSSSSLRNGEFESRLETLEQNRVSIARRMTTMKKKKKKKQSGNNNNDDDYGTTAFSLLSSRIHEVAEYVDSAVRNTVVSNQRKTREENILRELDLFVDGDEDAIETNTIRGKEVNEEKENRVEWIRKFGIENSMMMSGGKMDEEDLNAERSLRAFEMNDDEKGGVRKSGKEKGVVFLLDDDVRRAKEEEDLEKAIEKNVLSTVDLAIKRLETASAAIAKATAKNSKETGGAAGIFATAISNFSALPVWQKRVVGVLAFLGFSWILILNAMNNDEKSEFEEIDQSIATTANAS